MTRCAFRLYLITDEAMAAEAPAALCARIAAALAGLPAGAAAVQLRGKTLDGRRLLERALALRQVTRAHGAALLVNDRLDVALAAGADGVHLPGAGLPVAQARRLAPGLMLGASTHRLDEARAAAEDGADFVTFGPVYATPSKAGLGEPVGVEALARAVAAVPIPVFALGGIDQERAPACVAAGARLAVIRAVLAAPSPGDAATRLHATLR